MLTFGSLFAGIGGFDLGLERAGMRCLWQCEIDPYAQRVLEKHWPDVLRVPDIRDLRAGTVPAVDLICGGFPCQDISYANPAAVGIAGARSGLWAEMFRVIGELRPRYVIVENVPALLARGLHVVLGDLASIGFDAEWDCLPASAFGAHHRRDRVWIVAYPDGPGRSERWWTEPVRTEQPPAERGRQDCPYCAPDEACGLCAGDARRAALAHAERKRRLGRTDEPRGSTGAGAHAESQGTGLGWRRQWEPEPNVGRVATRVPARVDRLRALGNALVPQIAEWIGRRIIEFEGGRAAA